MTRLSVPAGLPLATTARRLRGQGLWLPTLNMDGVLTTASTRLTGTATGSGTAHTKGDWLQLTTAPTTVEATMVTLVVTANTNTNNGESSTLLDIGIDPTGGTTWAVVVPNIGIGWKSAGASFDFPVFIPVGSRIAIRIQALETLPKTVAVHMLLSRYPHSKVPAKLVNIGANEATSRGIGLTQSGSNNTKAAYTQIIAATTQPFTALTVCLQGNADTSLTAGGGLIDIAIGPDAGPPVIVIPDIPVIFGSTESITEVGGSRCQQVNIPAGSRIAARYAANTANNGVDVILLGVPSS